MNLAAPQALSGAIPAAGLAALAIYNVALIAAGLWARSRVRTADDFYIGGRGLGPLVAGLSYGATASSAWMIFGLTGFAYANGAGAIWILLGIWSGYAVAWLVIGPKLSVESRDRGHITLPDYLAADATPKTARLIRALSGLFIVIALTFYVASQLDGAGRAFAFAIGWPFEIALVVGAGIILAYTFLGGFWAASVTDAAQGVIMAVIALALPAVAILSAGGFAPLSDRLIEASPMAADVFAGQTGFTALGFAAGLAAIGLGYLGQPQALNRIMALQDERARKLGFAAALAWAVLLTGGMAIFGVSARALFPGIIENETTFLTTTQALLPVALAGVVIAAVLSAAMSTTDSILLSIASAVSHDMGAEDRLSLEPLLLARITMVGVAVSAVMLTLYAPASIFARALFAWSAMAAAFGPMTLARALGRTPPGWAVISSIAAGFLLTIILYWQPNTPGDWAERLLPWGPALAFAFIPRQRRA